MAALLLGCTHYPLLRQATAELVGRGVAIIDSADATADRVSVDLARLDLLACKPVAANGSTADGGLVCLVSDNPHRFARVRSRFLGEPIERVSYIGPDDFFAVAAMGETR
jgi:glutamate racemase